MVSYHRICTFRKACVCGTRNQIAILNLHLQFYDAGNDQASSSTVAEEAETPLDLDNAIANEVAELKQHSNDVFTFHKTFVNGLLYISMAASAGEPRCACFRLVLLLATLSSLCLLCIIDNLVRSYTPSRMPWRYLDQRTSSCHAACEMPPLVLTSLRHAPGNT